MLPAHWQTARRDHGAHPRNNRAVFSHFHPFLGHVPSKLGFELSARPGGAFVWAGFCLMPAVDWSRGFQQLSPNHSSYCFHFGTDNSPNWSSDLISVPLFCSDFLPSFSFWLVKRFYDIFPATVCSAFTLELWIHLNDFQTLWMYHHAAVLFCQKLASDLLRGSCALSRNTLELLSYSNCKFT